MESLPEDCIQVRRELEKSLSGHHEQLMAEKEAVQSVRMRVLAVRRAVQDQKDATDRAAAGVRVEMARQREADDALARLRARYAWSKELKPASELQEERRVARATVIDLELKRLQLVAGPLGQQSRALGMATQRLAGDLQFLADQHRFLEAAVSEMQIADEALVSRGETPGSSTDTLKARWIYQAAFLDERNDSKLENTDRNAALEGNQCSDLLQDLEERLVHQQRRNAFLSTILKEA